MTTARTRALRERWAQFRETARRRWTRLSDADLSAIDGRVERLTSLLQDLYGLERVEAREQVNEWLRHVLANAGPASATMTPTRTMADAGHGGADPVRPQPAA